MRNCVHANTRSLNLNIHLLLVVLQESNNCRGYAFVSFLDNRCVEECLRLQSHINGVRVHLRPISKVPLAFFLFADYMVEWVVCRNDPLYDLMCIFLILA